MAGQIGRRWPRFNERPAGRYVHPRAPGADEDTGCHEVLEIAGEAAPNYLQWIADLCEPHLGRSVLEIGAGVGSITARIATGRQVVATDISEESLSVLRQRFKGSDNVRVATADLTNLDLEQAFDSVVLVNVLEHVLDDVNALASLARCLRPGGAVIIYVPALNGLYGDWDRRFGHFRRYSRWRLRKVVEESGLRPQALTYANLLALPAWAAFSHMSKTGIDSTGGRSLPVWDRTGVVLSRLIESRVRVPIGLNLLCVARSAQPTTETAPGDDFTLAR